MELLFIFITMTYVKLKRATWGFTYEDKTLKKSGEGRGGVTYLDIIIVAMV
jgi:hypothetical protein